MAAYCAGSIRRAISPAANSTTAAMARCGGTPQSIAASKLAIKALLSSSIPFSSSPRFSCDRSTNTVCNAISWASMGSHPISKRACSRSRLTRFSQDCDICFSLTCLIAATCSARDDLQTEYAFQNLIALIDRLNPRWVFRFRGLRAPARELPKRSRWMTAFVSGRPRLCEKSSFGIVFCLKNLVTDGGGIR